MEIEVQVKAVVTDSHKDHIVLLEDLEKTKILPIWIGPIEAQAIAMPLQDEYTLQPLTHDLLKKICDELKGEVCKVIIKDINSQGTYIAEVHLQFVNEYRVLDSRPSDAIALALRATAPIFISIKLIEFTLNPDSLNLRSSD